VRHEGSSGKGASDESIDQLAPLEREAQAWVARFASGQATSADIEALKEWYAQSPAHAAALNQVSRLWDVLGPAGEGVVRRNLSVIYPPALAFGGRRVARRALVGGALAASAAGIGYVLFRPPFGLWPSFAELTADYRTATGEQKQIALAAGVSIEMSAQTSIAVRSAAPDARHVELIAGEAAILAMSEASGPVIVTAGGGRSIASEASFDVRYIGATVCVTCLEGTLRVEQGDAAQSLQPRQQLLYSARGMSGIRAVDPAVVTAWRDGFLVFHATPLTEAVEEINRYRAGKIILVDDALGQRLFNARFRIANVDEVVDQIRQVFGARITSLPGGIVLLG
jgi:transmembrane sensor